MEGGHKVYVYSSAEKVTDVCFSPRNDLGRLVLECDIDDPDRMVKELIWHDKGLDWITTLSERHLRYRCECGVVLCDISSYVFCGPVDFPFVMRRY